MKKSLFTLCLVLLFASSAFAGSFTLSSPTIKKGGTLTDEQVFNGFGCTGKNISPALTWKNPPKGTQSFALTVYDPDAPTGSGWWHWVLFDIPASVHALPANASVNTKELAGAVQSLTDFGTNSFGGACPPAGDKPHRYIFTIHALKVANLGIDAKSMPALVGFMIHNNSLGSASFTTKYGR